jgi:glutamyl-tRNA synthetase
MILGSDGKKLSKRHGATAVGDYQDMGILPVAMRNFLALLGWSPGDDLEILPEDEMIGRFSLDGIQSKPAVFDVAKLEWMNGQYLSALPASELRVPVRRQLDRLGATVSDARLDSLITAVKARSRTVIQLAEQVAVRADASRIADDERAAALRQKMGESFGTSVQLAHAALETVAPDQWSAERLVDVLKETATAKREARGPDAASAGRADGLNRLGARERAARSHRP